MDRDEIKRTIDEYIMLVTEGTGSTAESELKLKLLLDKLALAQHFAAYKFDEREYADAPNTVRQDLRKLAAARFPNYGYYNMAMPVTQKIGDGEVIVGDAIDDIMDIARELTETKWCWENNSMEDGLWHFKNSFEFHWSQHLRQLQIYLLNLERGT